MAYKVETSNMFFGTIAWIQRQVVKDHSRKQTQMTCLKRVPAAWRCGQVSLATRSVEKKGHKKVQRVTSMSTTDQWTTQLMKWMHSLLCWSLIDLVGFLGSFKKALWGKDNPLNALQLGDNSCVFKFIFYIPAMSRSNI